MQFIRAELQLVEERHGGKFGFDDDDKMEGRRIMDKKLSKHTEAVAKLHESGRTVSASARFAMNIREGFLVDFCKKDLLYFKLYINHLPVHTKHKPE